ncbi:biliverdin-producing heme oxygenase [Ancylobacter sp. MQZ15Z-1]|uniref:Biliverdin-producing heme oxygenase n=1 Tax=Ancylobacter mangrovi TaxID=2972472 RepID=A0A9X2PDL2_9HYPH|nr:biliverdin-producing heme oxygenase [Ancylobacter mangrovi]MCS0495970.1 biliverdin-producing heme oxygenase [Ancylobacter mangrovi]
MTIATDAGPETRAKRLRAATSAAHERVDHAVMAANPFADRESYARFLRFQFRLHRHVEPLYADPAMHALLPDLSVRSRLAALEQDLADLGLAPPDAAFGSRLPQAEALGWLYVVEGSNMGAAFLAKDAAKIGFSDTFGARHLAGHPEGRGLHWRRFTAALDAVELDEDSERAAEQAACAAFDHVLGLIGDELGREGAGSR